MMLRSLLVLCTLSFPPMQAWAASSPTKNCPTFPTTKKMKLQSVAQEMDFNGIPMTLYQFTSEEDMENVLSFYRSTWAGKGDGGRNAEEYPVGEWKAIATLRENCFYTAQVKPRGRGSEGLLGLSAAPGKSQVKEEVPMLPGSKVINDIAHNDSGKTARTLLLKNGFSADTNADFYRKNLGDMGWKVLTGHQGTNRDTRASTMTLKQGVREVSITITQKGSESNVLLNYVDQP